VYPTGATDKLHFLADSNAAITKGIIALVLLTVQDRSAGEIDATDIAAELAPFDLKNQLEPDAGHPEHDRIDPRDGGALRRWLILGVMAVDPEHRGDAGHRGSGRHDHPLARMRPIDNGHRMLGADLEARHLICTDRCLAALALAGELAERLVERGTAIGAEPALHLARAFPADQHHRLPVRPDGALHACGFMPA
jgi:hypothetical protein